MCTYNICHFNKCVFFTINFFFHKLLNYSLMFKCNEHVEINKCLCSLACTWMTIIDSQGPLTVVMGITLYRCL